MFNIRSKTLLGLDLTLKIDFWETACTIVIFRSTSLKLDCFIRKLYFYIKNGLDPIINKSVDPDNNLENPITNKQTKLYDP